MALSQVSFHRSWNREKINEHIRNIFPHLSNVPFEILVPIGEKVVVPSLPPNEELTGETMKRIFDQKAVYIRPFEKLTCFEETSNSLDSFHELADVLDIVTSLNVLPGSTTKFDDIPRTSAYFSELPGTSTDFMKCLALLQIMT